MRTLLKRLRHECGQDLVEYALLLFMAALSVTAGMETIAIGIEAAYATSASHLNATLGTGGNNGNQYGQGNGAGSGNGGSNQGQGNGGQDNGFGKGNKP